MYEIVGHNNQTFIPLRWVGCEKVANVKLGARGFQEHNDNMLRNSPICTEESRNTKPRSNTLVTE